MVEQGLGHEPDQGGPLSPLPKREGQRRAQFAAAAGTIPAGRVGRAEDVADAIRYLIGASYVTGSILPVDGGFTVA
ncbi:SDR family oxidoreductase [Nonomuraea cypriaca]|uniref:SDR family oxidoreductase n=1 Tax=Nonomuraea cypriaca TaxID=1187855 RepID=UPI002E2C3972|nr:SDR family oxidoreductase [Nonomuraea cypriaca]